MSGEVGPEQWGEWGGGACRPPALIQPHKSSSNRLVIIPKAQAGSEEPLSLGFSNFAGNSLAILRTNTAHNGRRFLGMQMLRAPQSWVSVAEPNACFVKLACRPRD